MIYLGAEDKAKCLSSAFYNTKIKLHRFVQTIQRGAVRLSPRAMRF